MRSIRRRFRNWQRKRAFDRLGRFRRFLCLGDRIGHDFRYSPGVPEAMNVICSDKSQSQLWCKWCGMDARYELQRSFHLAIQQFRTFRDEVLQAWPCDTSN